MIPPGNVLKLAKHHLEILVRIVAIVDNHVREALDRRPAKVGISA